MIRATTRTLATAALSATLAAALPAAAPAETVSDEISGYRQIYVNFNDSAGTCNLTDDKMFADRLAEKLLEIGVNRYDGAGLDANLGISANAQGTLSTSCAWHVQLSFIAVLPAEAIQTSAPSLRAALDRLGDIPVMIYRRGRFGSVALSQPARGGPSVTAQEAVLTAIDTLVEEFAKSRTK